LKYEMKTIEKTLEKTNEEDSFMWYEC
jgi:hypothetical protein